MSKFRKALVLDWETTGIPDPFSTEPFLTGPQGIQVGACIVDDVAHDWEIVDEFQATIRWLGPDPELKTQPELPGLTWDEKAFEIHGLSRPSLRDKPRPEELASPFRNFLTRHFNSYTKIVLCGQNPDFDRYFTNQFLLFADLLNDPSIKFSHRMLDSFTAGFFAFGCTHSDELFKLVSNVKRDKHGALEDARLTVEAFRAIAQKKT